MQNFGQVIKLYFNKYDWILNLNDIFKYYLILAGDSHS